MDLATYDRAASVERGAELLRRHGVAISTLSPDGLNVAELHACPLALAFGDYYTGLERVFGVDVTGGTDSNKWAAIDRLAIAHGFDAPGGLASYRALTDEWVRLIVTERNA